MNLPKYFQFIHDLLRTQGPYAGQDFQQDRLYVLDRSKYMSDDRQCVIVDEDGNARAVDLLLGLGVCLTSVDGVVLRCEVFGENTNT